MTYFYCKRFLLEPYHHNKLTSFINIIGIILIHKQRRKTSKMSVQEKPTAAFVLSLIGGIFILLGAMVYLVFGLFISATSSMIPFVGVVGGAVGGVIVVYGILGLVWSILVIYGATLISSGETDKVRTGSILVLIFSIISWFGAGGGFFIGFILGLIGAILGLIWKPSGGAPTAAPAISRICPNCGRVIEKDVKFCPHCGKSLE